MMSKVKDLSAYNNAFVAGAIYKDVKVTFPLFLNGTYNTCKSRFSLNEIVKTQNKALLECEVTELHFAIHLYYSFSNNSTIVTANMIINQVDRS